MNELVPEDLAELKSKLLGFLVLVIDPALALFFNEKRLARNTFNSYKRLVDHFSKKKTGHFQKSPFLCFFIKTLCHDLRLFKFIRTDNVLSGESEAYISVLTGLADLS